MSNKYYFDLEGNLKEWCDIEINELGNYISVSEIVSIGLIDLYSEFKSKGLIQ
jgi:hypothetical protein